MYSLFEKINKSHGESEHIICFCVQIQKKKNILEVGVGQYQNYLCLAHCLKVLGMLVNVIIVMQHTSCSTCSVNQVSPSSGGCCTPRAVLYVHAPFAVSSVIIYFLL